MNLIRRDYRRGDLITVHKKDGSTVRGTYVRRTRRYMHLERYAIEAGGELVQMKGDRLLVPLVNEEITEVVKP